MKKLNTLKKIGFFLALFLLNQTIKAQNEFISVWRSSAGQEMITIPTNNGLVYNYNVNWGDGTENNNVVGDINHTYLMHGNYTVTITGLFPAIYFDKNIVGLSNRALASIEQWGNNQWQTMEGAFTGQTSLIINSIDVPDLSQCTSMIRMFRRCSGINNGSHNKWNQWNTSTITRMDELFFNVHFDKNINDWDVSNVTDMSYMFYFSFSVPNISNWDTSSVTNMAGMFQNGRFNGDISNWDVSSVTNMKDMFYGNNFNQNINNWNVANVTDMSGMFAFSEFNGDISNWDTRSVTNMSLLFKRNHVFNQAIGNWNVSNVTNMESMFFETVFNQPLSNWNVSNVTDMSAMFYNAARFNQDIGNWNVSSVTDMNRMFRAALDFNQDIGSWNVSNVTDMELMFLHAATFNQSINDWDVSKITNMYQMFVSATSFNQSLNNWDVSKVTNMSYMFADADNFNQPLNNWNVSMVTNMSYMFSHNDAFNQSVNNWNVSNVNNTSFMFSNATSYNQPLNNWNVSNVTSIFNMFENATLFNQPLNNWDTSKVESMTRMFMNANAFNQNVSNWNMTSVTSCFEMFKGVKLSKVNYEALLIGWNAQNLQQNVSFDAGNSTYFSNAAEAAKLNMINNDNWTITDGGKIQEITWTGANDTNWNDAANWDTNTIPTQIDNVFLADVANAPRINANQNQTINNLTNHAILTIRSNASLTVLGDIDQRNTISVSSFVNTNGSLVVRGNQLNVNPADIVYLRYVSGNNWHTIASPVTNFDMDVFAAASPLAEGQNNNRGIGFYDNNTNPRWSYYQNGADGTGNFIAGKGYSIRTNANAFLTFRGKLNTNNVSNYPITENLDGWNLVGNPYPAFINANTNADENENFLTENAVNLDPNFANIYIWNPTTESYEPVGNGLGARYIAPGQGFFVKAKENGGVINIEKSMLSHQAGDLFLKGNQPQKIVLQINDGTNLSETTIAFKSGMIKGLDVTYDAAVFSGDNRNLSLFTNLIESNENVPFAIQFLPELANNDFIIPIGISQKEASEITLSLKENNLSSHQKIYLEDKLENTFTEISNNSDYTFSRQKNTSETGRFFLHFQQKALNIEENNALNINIYKGKNEIIHINGISDGLLNIFDITGKNVLKNYNIKNQSEKVQLPKLSKGVYLINIKANGINFTKKLLF